MGTERPYSRGSPDAGGSSRSGKHSLYFNLVDAFEQRGCPICRLALSAVYRWLDAFAYENVNDYDVRAALRRSRGFCTTHAWQLIDEIHDLAGAAIVYRDVIHSLLPSVRAAVHQPAALAPEDVCRACVALEEASDHYLDVFHESLPERAFRQAYEAGPAALCRAHAQDLLERIANRRLAEEAAALVARHWQRIVADGATPAGEAALAPPPRRRYRGIAGATMTFSAASFSVPEPALLKDPLTVPLELLAGRPRTGTVRRGLRTATDWEVPPAPDLPDLPWEEACEPGACPICRLALADEERRLEARDAVEAMAADEVLALCNAHAWRLAERGHVAALAQASTASVKGLAQALATPARSAASRPNGTLFDLGALFDRGGTAGARLAVALDVADDCVWCLDRAALEAAAIDRLLASVRPGQAVLEALAASGGLCRMHFAWAMARGQGSAAAALLARLQVERWSALLADLEEYLRKQDYRFRHEPRGEEQSSPWRATEQVAGAREIRP
jgi:hypothetical protein